MTQVEFMFSSSIGDLENRVNDFLRGLHRRGSRVRDIQYRTKLGPNNEHDENVMIVYEEVADAD